MGENQRPAVRQRRKTSAQRVDPAQLVRREAIFRVYRDLGPARSYDRLLAAIEKKHGSVSKRTLANWSRQHSWQQRIAEHDREMEEGLQEQPEPLDPNFDKVDALLRAAHLTMMRVLQACPVVKTARDAKAMLDAAVTAMKLAEMLRGNQRTPEDNEESRKRMWALIDKFEEAKRAQFEAMEGKTKPLAGRLPPPPNETRDDTASPD
jgi:hypothetical protein